MKKQNELDLSAATLIWLADIKYTTEISDTKIYIHRFEFNPDKFIDKGIEEVK